jgi:hypothetical protein
VKNPAFLSLILWPEAFSEDEKASLLAEHVPADSHTARMWVKREPPAILATLAPDVAARVVAAVEGAGGDAFAPTLADIEALGPTLKIRDMRLYEGGIVVDLWRGPTTRIERGDVQVLVRAKLSETTRKAKPPPLSMAHRGSWIRSAGIAGTIGWGWGGSYGMAAGLYLSHVMADSGAAETAIRTSAKLDLHVADGSVYQVDGDKFGFRILGDRRAMSDNVNIDRMCELMAHLCPDEIVDPYFSLWHPPAAHERLRLPQMKVNRDDPAFAFYSRWAALMYRHLMA